MNLDQYKEEYKQAMAQQGVKVEFNEDGVPGGVPDVGGYRNPDNWVATLSRDGITTTALVTLGRISVTGMSAEQLAAQDVWNLRFAGATQSPQGSLPSTWFANEDDDLRRFYEMYPEKRPGYTRNVSIPNPGPSPTVPVGTHSNQTQTTQAPTNPNGGTVLTNPVADSRVSTGARFTFWQWNYFYEKQTGRPGPSPDDVGVAVGTTLMSGDEWVRSVGNWYGGPVSVPSTSGGATGGVGANPTTPSVPVGEGGAGGTPPVGTPPPPPANPGPDADRKSFWTWNALMEQASGIVGPDPAPYHVAGDTLMTRPEWEALTSAYYEAKKNEKAATKPTDNTLLYMGAAAAAFLLLRKG